MAGVLVALEGIDQAGKMTQALDLQAHLRRAGLRCEIRHYPDYDTAIGQLIRSFLGGGPALDPRTRCLLFAANRWEKDADMRALVAANDVVCVDRYIASNLVYGMSQGLDAEWLAGLEAGLLPADLTLLVDISPEESRRRKAQARDGYERDERLLAAARAAYCRIAAAQRWSVVDGQGDLGEVAARVRQVLAARLADRLPAVAAALS
jgi:dTMP kinase